MTEYFKYNKAITHSGRFHMDDVLSTVFLQSIKPNLIVDRMDQYVGEGDENTIVFDIGLGKFDHHQENKKVDEDGIPYSAFGLLWNEFGEDYLRSIGFTHVDEAFQVFKDNQVKKVNIGDNLGYKNVQDFYEAQLIINYNPKWYESEKDDRAFDVQFIKAVEAAKGMFDNWMRLLYENVEITRLEQQIWDEAVRLSINGIACLDHDVHWQTFIAPEDGIKMVVAKSERGGYKVQSTNSELYPIIKIPELSFVHSSRFLGVSDTKENAIIAANYAIKNTKIA